MNSSNFLALGAGAFLLAVVIWIVLPDRDDAEVHAGASSAAVARSTDVREQRTDAGAARARGARLEGDSGRRVVPGVAPRGEAPAGTALRSGAFGAEREALRPRPGGVGTSGESAGNSDVLADPQPEDLPTLKEMSLHDEDAQRRLAAVTLLGASDDPSVVPILSQALLDDNEDVRLAAVQALADFTDEMPVEAVEGALNDPSPDVRYEALEVLSEVGGDASRRAAAKALKDPDEDVRELAETMQGGGTTE